MQSAVPLACFLSMIRPPGVQFENSLLQIAPVDKAKCPFIRDHNDIEFRLYTRHNPSVYQELFIDDDERLFASNIDYHAPTVIYFHAFMENPDDGSAIMVREAYVLRGDTNVIMIDASRLEAGPWYFTAAENTWYIGRFAAQFIDYLVSRGLNLNNTHLVGHSLGAQAAGVAGASLKSGRVARITGLDPALPLFHGLPLEQRLDKSDAEFVDVIHTDAGIFGVNKPVGHADFYPNGGISPQPGCELEVVIPKQLLLNKCDPKMTPSGFYTFYLTPNKNSKNSQILTKKLQKLFTQIQVLKTGINDSVRPVRVDKKAQIFMQANAGKMTVEAEKSKQDTLNLEDQIMVESAKKYSVVKPDFVDIRNDDYKDVGTMKPIMIKKDHQQKVNIATVPNFTTEIPEILDYEESTLKHFHGEEVTKLKMQTYLQNEQDRSQTGTNKETEKHGITQLKPNKEILKHELREIMLALFKQEILNLEPSKQTQSKLKQDTRKQILGFSQSKTDQKTQIEDNQDSSQAYFEPEDQNQESQYYNPKQKPIQPVTNTEIWNEEITEKTYYPETLNPEKSRPKPNQEIQNSETSQAKPNQDTLNPETSEPKPNQGTLNPETLQPKPNQETQNLETSQPEPNQETQGQEIIQPKPNQEAQNSKTSELTPKQETRHRNHVIKRQRRFINPFKRSEDELQENFLFKMLNFLIKNRKNIPVYSVFREINTLVKSAQGELNHISKERNNYIGAPPPLIPVSYSLELGGENKAVVFVKRLLGLTPKGDRLTINGSGK